MRRFFLSPFTHILMEPTDEGGDGGGGQDGKKKSDDTTNNDGKKDDKKEDKKEEIEDPLKTDIKVVIEKARKQEKDKLYDTIKAAEERAKKAEADNQKLMDALAALKDPNKGDDKKGKKKDDAADDKKTDGIDDEKLNKIVTATIDTVSKSFEEKLSAATKLIEDQRKEIDTIKSQKAGETIAAIRERLIKANEDSIIPELVQGNTPEELEQSLVTAKQVFARTTKGLKKESNEGQATAKPTTIVIPPTPNVTGQGTPGQSRTIDVSSMSTADYKANRAALLTAAAAEARRAIAQNLQ